MAGFLREIMGGGYHSKYNDEYDNSTAMSSTMPRSGAYAVVITLSPTDGQGIRRTLHVGPKDRLMIGRASRSETKNLQAAADNALFDCPVVSRQHAELYISPYNVKEEKVTIVDKDSMHGTYVNSTRLAPFKPFTLRDGDHIQLGDRVSRGHETHEGIFLRFSRQASTNSPFFGNQARSTNTFNVPDPSSDEEDSDMASDNGSIISVDEPTSSAKTTPEQAKAKAVPGSQQAPIDLESGKRAGWSAVINLDDDDEDEDEVTIIKNPATVAVQARVIHDTYQDDEDEAEVESVLAHNTGLAQILNPDENEEDEEEVEMLEDDDEMAMREEEEAAMHEDDEEGEVNDEQHYSSNGNDIAEEDLSPSEASDLSQYDHHSDREDEQEDEEPQEEQDDYDEEAPDVLSSKMKQASPELGEIAEPEQPEYSPHSPARPNFFNIYRPERYDPVRSPMAPPAAAASYMYTAPPPPPPRHTAFGGYMEYNNIPQYPHSRWDVRPDQPQPPTAPGLSTGVFGSAYAPSFAADSLTFGPPFGRAPPPPPPATQATQFYSYPSSSAPAPAPETDKGKQPKRISIDDMLDAQSESEGLKAGEIERPFRRSIREAEMADEEHEEAAAVERDLFETAVLQAKEQVSSVVEGAKAASTKVGSKRKADEMSLGETELVLKQVSERADGETSVTPVVDVAAFERASKRAKKTPAGLSFRGLRKSVAVAAKYGAVAAAGAVGGVWFLASDYAPQVLGV